MIPVLVTVLAALVICAPLIWVCERARPRQACGHCGRRH